MPCNKGCDYCDSKCDLCGDSFEIYCNYFYNCDKCYNSICFPCSRISTNIVDLYELYKKKRIENIEEIFTEKDFEGYGCINYDANELNVELFEDEYMYNFIQKNYVCIMCEKEDLTGNNYKCIISLSDLKRYKKLEEENKKLKSLLQ